ncbi:nuclear transport factor 2 family protein [Advenella sp. WQ 585]|uniref:Nuclear transport factor 2 family protein n=1 Tax=Advenella mandrilli TaxID=2800330 RepID=A0ABS1EDC7_9BURK|nr:nuclear transport factor 2 family protein [Advenella mandrilli]MBK1780101.1 nuclear transport factor 2 family protein [Advenella mandrilli]
MIKPLHSKALLRYLVLCASLGTATFASTPALANQQADKAAISARLHDWAAAFNTRDAAEACTLFAPDLISTVQGAADAGRDAVCARLSALLENTDVSFHYRPDIQEILVSGGMAVVRLVWTLTEQQGEQQNVSQEAGLDVFKRQPDGQWSIIRFMSFPIEPD